MLIILTLAAASSGGGFDPAVVAAIIGGIAAVVAAIAAFLGVMYGSRQQKKMMRFQKELDAQEAATQQEKQRKADTLEAARREMLLAQNNAERARAYRRALHADPRISRLQILDMSRPLEVTSVYVRVRVHEEARLRYEVDPQLSRSEQERNPNAMLQASRAYMERRASTAIDPDEALRKYRRCAILGDPGAGKTTLLKYLALKSADKQLADLPDLPIHKTSACGDPVLSRGEEAGAPFGLVGGGAERFPPGCSAERYSYPSPRWIRWRYLTLIPSMVPLLVLMAHDPLARTAIRPTCLPAVFSGGGTTALTTSPVVKPATIFWRIR